MSLSLDYTKVTGLLEFSPRERLAALLDGHYFAELAGPFDRIHSPWLLTQGIVPQSDDGVIVVRGTLEGKEIVGIAIEGSFEGGSIGEVGGAKIATALELAAESCRKGRPVAALLLLETGGVRLQESILGLAAIAAIQSAIIELRELAAVVAVVAGPVGCFGGMSLAAELCTYIVGTPHGRLGMNGPEVIEQEAGADEIDSGDRELIWQIVGCEARMRDGWIDTFVQDEIQDISRAIREGITRGAHRPLRAMNAAAHLAKLRSDKGTSHEASRSQAPLSTRSRTWIERLSKGGTRLAFETPSVITADVTLPNAKESALAISIVPDSTSRLPRASSGELGLEQAWALSACIHQFIAEEKKAGTCRPIIAIVDTPGQAFGATEERRCISAAASAAVEAYALARRAGHPVLTLVVGRAVSGAFLAHGLQSDHIFALTDQQVSMYAMSAQSIARITRRTLAEVQTIAAKALPMSFAIEDAWRLGVIHTLIDGVDCEDPTVDDLRRITTRFEEMLLSLRAGKRTTSSIEGNPYREGTQKIRAAVTEQWSMFPDKMSAFDRVGTASHGIKA